MCAREACPKKYDFLDFCVIFFLGAPQQRPLEPALTWSRILNLVYSEQRPAKENPGTGGRNGGGSFFLSYSINEPGYDLSKWPYKIFQQVKNIQNHVGLQCTTLYHSSY